MDSTPIPPSHRPTSPNHQHLSDCPPQDLAAPSPTTDRWAAQALKSQIALDDSVFDAMDSIHTTLDQVQQCTRVLETNILSSLEPLMKMDHFLATTRMLSDIMPPPSFTNGLAALSQAAITPPALPSILTSPGINLLPPKEIFQPMHDVVQQKVQTMALLPTQLAANNLQAITAGIVQPALDAAAINMSMAARLMFDSLDKRIFTQSALTFPAFQIVKNDFWQTAFLPDMAWTVALTEQINSLLKILPDWPSIDPRGFKKNLKKRIIDALGMLGLCFAPSMSEDMMYEVLDRVELGNKKTAVQLLIWNYYAYQNHKRLRQAMERWQDNPEYARRWRDYLHPAFIAHTQGHYGLSINALMPMVEGIASHVVQKMASSPLQNPKEAH